MTTFNQLLVNVGKLVRRKSKSWLKKAFPVKTKNRVASTGRRWQKVLIKTTMSRVFNAFLLGLAG